MDSIQERKLKERRSTRQANKGREDRIGKEVCGGRQTGGWKATKQNTNKGHRTVRILRPNRAVPGTARSRRRASGKQADDKPLDGGYNPSEKDLKNDRRFSLIHTLLRGWPGRGKHREGNCPASQLKVNKARKLGEHSRPPGPPHAHSWDVPRPPGPTRPGRPSARANILA